jgi:hypothetical protein
MVSSVSSGCEFYQMQSHNNQTGKRGLTMGSRILTSGVGWVLLGSVQIGLGNGFIN